MSADAAAVRSAHAKARAALPHLTVIKTDHPLPHQWSIKLSRDEIIIDGSVEPDAWIRALRHALETLLRHHGIDDPAPHLRVIPGGRIDLPVRAITGTDGH